MTARVWQDDAACRAADPVLMQAEEDHPQVNEAKRVCAGCPVRALCGSAGLTETAGVWGGYTAYERARLAKGRNPARCVHCQTEFVPAGKTVTRCLPCRGKTGPDRCRDQIVRLAAADLPLKQIARAVGLHREAVSRAIRHWGVAYTSPNRRLLPCGTAAAYQRHLKQGEEPCAQCRAANRARKAACNARRRQRVAA